MLSTLITGFLTVASYASASAQAEGLMSYVQGMYEYHHEIPVTFDNSGFLWVGFYSNDGIYVSRLDSRGKAVLDKTSVRQGKFGVGKNMVCDRWNNAYFVISESDGSTLHLVRVTPAGQVTDYHPWPRIMWAPNLQLEIIPPDTLLVVGLGDVGNVPGGDRVLRVCKGYLTLEGLTPSTETDYDRFTRAGFSGYLSPMLRNCDEIVDWNSKIGIGVGIPANDSEKLGSAILDFGPPSSDFSSQFLGYHLWRNYVWRSYKDTWIASVTMVPHKDGGYSVFIPDPKDLSITHVVRLTKEGEPIAPSELTQGGEQSVRSFSRLPESAEPHAYFEVYKVGITLDSARVSFWGCDEEGFLYNYTTLRKY